MSKIIELYKKDDRQEELDSKILNTFSDAENNSQLLISIKLSVILLSLSLAALVSMVGSFDDNTNKVLAILISIGTIIFLILWPLYFLEKKNRTISKCLRKIE